MANKHFTGILNPHESYYNGYRVTDFELSKDGTKARYEDNKGQHCTQLEWGHVLKDFKSFEEDFKKNYGKTKHGRWGIREANGKYEVLTGIYMSDDDFDDIVHIGSSETYQFSFRTEMAGSKADIVDGTKIYACYNSGSNIFLFTNINSAILFLEKKFTDDGFKDSSPEQDFKEKFDKWLEEHGYTCYDEIWKDYNGTTEQTEWAIDNNIDPGDFDTWQATERVLKHELSYSEAIKVAVAVEEIGLTMMDCE